MKSNSFPPIANIGIALYIIGACLGFLLALLAAWADVEAQTYGFYRRADQPLNGLQCPILMTAGEESKIFVRIANTTDKPLVPNVRVEISTPALADIFTQSVRLEPGESRTLAWTVGPQNIDLGNFIFASALVYAAHPLPEQQSMCGIYIVRLPGKGAAIVMLTIALSLLCMGGGLYALYRNADARPRLNTLKGSLTAAAFLILIALIATFLGWWLQSVIALVITALLTAVTLGLLFRKEG